MFDCLCCPVRVPCAIILASFQVVLQSFLGKNPVPEDFPGLGARLPDRLQSLQPGEHHDSPVAAARSQLQGQEGPCFVPQLTAACAMCVLWDRDTGCPQGGTCLGSGELPHLSVRGPAAWGHSVSVTVPSLPTQDWGMEMLYRQVKLPVLSIKNFVVETPAEKRRYKKWGSVTFPIKEFDYLEFCSDTCGLSF